MGKPPDWEGQRRRQNALCPESGVGEVSQRKVEREEEGKKRGDRASQLEMPTGVPTCKNDRDRDLTPHAKVNS